MRFKKVKTLKELMNHPFVNSVWKEGQDNQYDDCDEVFWLTLKDGYWFECEQSSLITTRGYVKEIVSEFNQCLHSIEKDPRN